MLQNVLARKKKKEICHVFNDNIKHLREVFFVTEHVILQIDKE